jgi:hypothetical protein
MNDHLFFSYNSSKAVWDILGNSLGARGVPKSFWQAMTWLYSYAPRMEKFYVVLIAAIFWAIWNVKNMVTFEEQILRSPSKIIFFAFLCCSNGQVYRRRQTKIAWRMGRRK